MGKKKPPKKPAPPPAPRVPRKEPYSKERMNGVIERVKEQTVRMAALSRVMGDAELDAVVIDGHAMLLRGLNQIDNFLDNASRAVREAKGAKQKL